jgi:hypothetical protein
MQGMEEEGEEDYNRHEALVESFNKLVTATKPLTSVNVENILKLMNDIEDYKITTEEAFGLGIDKILEKVKAFKKVIEEMEKYSCELFSVCSSNKDISINEFNFYKEYSKLICYRDSKQYYTDILQSEEFKLFFKSIIISECHTSYYKTLDSKYIEAINKNDTFQQFYESIKEVPMHRNCAGMTFSSMYVFINGNPLYTVSEFTEDQIKAVNFI